MNANSIPEDIARIIVEQIPRDHLPTLKALATVAKTFISPCQEVLFNRLVINFRRKNLEDHILNMYTFLTANPSLRPYVRHLEIADNNMPSEHKGEGSAPLIEISTPELYSPSELSLNRNIIYALLSRQHSLLPRLLSYLVNPSSIAISMKNVQFSWLQFSPTLENSLVRLFRMPHLQQLYIQGLRFIPVLALAHFRDLNELYLKECDMAVFRSNAYSNRAFTRKFGHRKGVRRLRSLTIQDLPASSFQVLLNHWQSNTDFRFIDMASPKELTIYVSNLTELSYLKSIFDMSEEAVETLTIHTWGLHLGTSVSPPTPIELGVVIPTGYSHHDWFYHAMTPFQLTRPSSLVNLIFNVSFWLGTDFPEANGELEWALQTLRDLPPTPNLKEVIINIRVGGQRKQDQLAFVDFQRYRGWNSWDAELADTSKWWDVESFMFVVCCDCGPKLMNGTDNIQAVIAKQMPLLMESGKLSVGHIVLEDVDGLTNYDFFQWINEDDEAS